jgi:hypothetical protein
MQIDENLTHIAVHFGMFIPLPIACATDQHDETAM